MTPTFIAVASACIPMAVVCTGALGVGVYRRRSFNRYWKGRG